MNSFRVAQLGQVSVDQSILVDWQFCQSLPSALTAFLNVLSMWQWMA
jgi:hypothetical protein